jgi:hypothetical protein
VPPPTSVPEPATRSTIEFPGVVRSIEWAQPTRR